jgi:hypothetical protein
MWAIMLALLYILLNAILLAMGVGIGYLLHWLLPRLDLLMSM